MNDWISRISDRDLVDALCEIEEGIGNAQFVESLVGWVIDDGRPLSESQRKVAEDILREHEGL